MDKKELKSYEAPTMDVVELDVAAPILAGSAETNPFEGNTGEPEVLE